MEPTKNYQFSGLRGFFWPIYKEELKKFIPMALIMMFAIIIYTTARDIKDTLLVTHASSQIIPFVNGIFVMTSSVIFMTIYIKLLNVLSKRTLFYSIIIFFSLFFIIFAFVLYPLHQNLQPSTQYINQLVQQYPQFHNIFSIYQNWVIVLFYIMGELWGSIGVSLLFWQFANEVTSHCEVKRFYTMYGLIAQIGAIFAGFFIVMVSHNTTTQNMTHNLKILSGLIIICLMGMLFCYNFINKHFPQQKANILHNKTKMSLKESLKFICTNSYLLSISSIIICYSVTLNFLEVYWLGQLKLWFNNNAIGYVHFMGTYSIFTGILTIILMFCGTQVLRFWSWKTAALCTPIVVSIFGSIFYLLSFNLHYLQFLNINLIGLISILGAFTISLSKSMKYSLFDTTKEMSYRPLDDEIRAKGKAVADIVGAKLGRSCAGWIQIVISMLMGSRPTVTNASPYLFIIFLIFCIIWFLSINCINRQYRVLNNKD